VRQLVFTKSALDFISLDLLHAIRKTDSSRAPRFGKLANPTSNV